MLPPPSSYFDLFRHQATRNPDSIALIQAGRSWTYAELLKRASANATRFRRLPGTHVGFLCERSREMVAAGLGVWAAGKSFTHLDPAHPIDYNRTLLADAGIAGLIADRRHAAAAAELCRDVLSLESAAGEPSAPPEMPAVQGDAESPAYVIFTSGSTGKPKGVVISHRALINFCRVAARTLEVEPRDVQLLSAPTTYALSVRQLFVPLTVGATVEIAARDDVADPARFFALLHARPITLIDVVPSFWRTCLEWLEHQPKTDLPGLTPSALRQIVSVGETLRTDLPRRWRALFGGGTRLVNIYGQTETTGIVARHEIPANVALDDAVCPVGFPAAETTLHLLDENMQPAADGRDGELFIDSPCLASGYLNDAATSREKFPPNPFPAAISPRLYRTGDVGRRLPDGAILHLGRKDQQVKVRGMRVEPGEIEHQLERIAGVARAHVLFHAETGDPGRLIAFLARAPAQDILSVGTIRAELRRHLPPQMIPAEFHFVDAIPTTAHGKADRAALLKGRRAGASSDSPSRIYQATWEPIVLPPPETGMEMTWVVFADRLGQVNGVAAAMTARGCSVILVPYPGSGAAARSDSFSEVFSQLRTGGVTAYSLLHAASLETSADDRTPRDRIADSHDSFRDAVVAARLNRVAVRELVYVTNGIAPAATGDQVIPEKCTVLGLGRTLELELPPGRFTALDVGDAAAPVVAERVLQITAGSRPAEDDTYAIRGAAIFSRRYRPLAESAAGAARFRNGGTYLFTGGTGDLALAIVHRLSQRITARFILLSRAGPGRWRDERLPENRRALALLQEIRSRGSAIDFVLADVSDEEVLRVALARHVKRGITGIVHAAGERGIFQPVGDAVNDRPQPAFDAKVFGTRPLLRLAGECRAEFVLLFSSMAAVLGRVGFADYCAANAFLDGLAHAGPWPCPVLAINWDTWRGTGLQKRLATERGAPDDSDPHALSLEEGVRLFELLSGKPAGHYLVSKVDLSERFADRPAFSADTIDDRPSTNAVAQIGAEEMRRRIRAVWTSVLRNSDFSDNASFFTIGGDSLAAVQVCLEVEKISGRRIPTTQFHQKPTVTRLLELAAPEAAAPSALHHGIVNAAGTKPPLLLWGVDLAMPLIGLLGADQPVIVPAAISADEIASRGLTLEAVVEWELEPFLPALAGKVCFVGGYSRGGIFAYEAARQLRRRGLHVPAVLMIDTSAYFVSAYVQQLPGWLHRWQAWQLKWSRYSQPLLRRSREMFKLPPWRIPDYCASWATDREIARIKAGRAGRRTLDAHGSAVASYGLPPSDIDIVLFKAAENSDRNYLERDYGWHRVTSGQVILNYIGGAHWSYRPTSAKFLPRPGILEPPYVERLAAAMNACMAKGVA